MPTPCHGNLLSFASAPFFSGPCRSIDLTKVVSPALQLPHSSLVRVTSKIYIAAAASDAAGLLCLQRAATLRHPCTAELSWPQHPWAQHTVILESMNVDMQPFPKHTRVGCNGCLHLQTSSACAARMQRTGLAAGILPFQRCHPPSGCSSLPHWLLREATTSTWYNSLLSLEFLYTEQ